MRYRVAAAAASAILITASAVSAISITGQDQPVDYSGIAAAPTVTRAAPDTANRSLTRPSLHTSAAPAPTPKVTKTPKPTASATHSHQPKPTKTPRASPTPTHTVVATTSPKAYALAKVGATQFACLDLLWEKESNWRVTATNPSSGAYGIPQALPASKMASAGSDWQTNAITQIRWGLGYIEAVYGTPCTAWAHSQATNWY
jgi:hypothetical protein